MRAHPLERALRLALRRLIMWLVPVGAFMLFIHAPTPSEGLLLYTSLHLVILQAACLALAAELAPMLDNPWFEDTRRPWLISAVSLVAVVTGFAALLTLATSALARYDPSLQFLQLLSSLDIAWVVSALFFGARKMWGTRTAWILGTVVILLCVGSIAAYLNVVGFTDLGGWLVNRNRLWTIVIPADTVAAIAAITVLVAAGSANQPTEQRSPQSYD